MNIRKNHKTKRIVLALATVLLFSLLLSVSLSEAGGGNTITIETVEGEHGETVSLDVTASGIDIAGFQLLVHYDPEYLNPLDAHLYIGEGAFTENLDYEPDKMAFMWDLHINATVNQMFRIDFEVIKEISGVSDVYINPADAYNEIITMVNGAPEEIVFTAVAGGVSGSGEPGPGPGNGDPEEGCYIATAVYGSSNAPEVVALRTYRDEVLQKTLPGRLFIKAYYTLSPPVANYLEDADTLNDWVRRLLDRIIPD